MSDGQAFAFVLALLLLGSVVCYLGLIAVWPMISHSRLFWSASLIPPIALSAVIGLHDKYSSFPDDLDNPFVHAGTDFEAAFLLILSTAFWIPCALTIKLLSLKRHRE